MKTIRALRYVSAALAVLAAAALSVADTTGTMPPPGTLNYVEGQVAIQGQTETPKSVGSTYLGTNQVLDTRDGNAEVLLTPGVYLRLGHNSEVEMVSPDLTNTQVKLTAGEAIVEVDQLFKENDVSVLVDGARTRIEKTGLYGFEAKPASTAVLDGKAAVFEGDHRISLKKGRELLLNSQQLKAQDLNKGAVENDPLYRWSKLRAEYASQSNVDVGNALLAEGGWFGPGWYWDPFWTDFAFMPGYGMFWGPFGWPFFSPAWVGFAPYYGAYGYGGFYHYRTAAGRPATRTGVGRGNLPPLARHAAPGSGFGGTPRAGFAPHMGRMSGGMMGGGMRMGPPAAAYGGMGGFRGGPGRGQ